MRRPRAASPGFVSRILTLALVASGLLVLPPVTGTALAIAPPPAPATGHIDEFGAAAGITTTATSLLDITTGSDGNLWFTDQGAPQSIGRITPAGTAQEFAISNTVGSPHGIATGADGNVWFTESSGAGNSIGAISIGGTLNPVVTLTDVAALPLAITPGPGGSDSLWFTEYSAAKVGNITTPTGTVTTFPTTTTAGAPTDIVLGADRNLWFTEQFATPFLGKITPAGVLTETQVTTTSNTNLGGITVGPDHNIWFTQQGVTTTTAGAIWRVDPTTGVTATFSVPAGAHPKAITAGTDGNIWFTDAGNNAIGSMDLTGTVLAEYDVPTANAFGPSLLTDVGGITSGPDGNIWFTEQVPGGNLGRLLVQPSLTVDPTTVAFGNQAVGATSTAQPVSLTATGGGAATITAVSVTPSANFAVSSNCTGAQLSPTSPSCTLSTTFTPTVTGIVTGTATVTSSASTSPQTFTLTGNGVVTGGGGPTIATTGVTPAVTNFYNQALGTTSTVKTVTLGNAGPGNLVVGGVLTTGTMASDFKVAPGTDTCTGTTLLAQQSCKVGVVFAPTVKGSRLAAIQFNTSAGPQYGLLVGRGVQASGYWLDASDGGIFSFGSGAAFFGSAGSIKLNKPIVGMAATPDSQGYWLVATDGGIFAYGDAGFYGSTGSITLNKPIVGMAPTPTGLGYWLVASDGGIFSYGDAKFYGSAGSIKLNKPIVGMASTPDGGGYWLVATDGGIFSYGNAGFYGSTGSIALNKPIVGMGSTPSGLGYWLVASDGGIFSYGDALFFGSTGSIKLNKPIVGMASTPTGKGYWLVATDGGIFAYGDAPFYGSTGSITLNKPIVGMAPAL